MSYIVFTHCPNALRFLANDLKNRNGVTDMNLLRNPESIISKTQSLYSLPGVAAQLLELTRNPQVEINDLKNCLEQDPALVGKLLRVVNSSLFGLSRSVIDLQQAMNVLGINPLRMLVLGFCLPERLFLFTNRDILGRYWRRTLLKATIARQLSKITNAGSSSEDDAFVAGLLSDIGILVMLQEYNDEFSAFLDVALRQADSLVEYEQMALGVDHLALGAMLIDRWNLPSHLVRLVEAGAEQHRIVKLPAPEQPLAQTLYLADKLSWCLAEEREDFWPVIYETIKADNVISNDQLQQLVRDVQLHVEQLADALRLPEFTTDNYELLTLNALERLSQLTEQQILQSMRSMQLRPLEQIQNEVRALQNAAQNKRSDSPQNESHKSAGRANSATAAYSSTATSINEDFILDSPVELYDNSHYSRSAGLSSSSQSSASQSSTKILRRDSSFAKEGSSKSYSTDTIPESLRNPLHAMLSSCRQRHQSLSLMLVEIDRYDDLVDRCGLVKAEQLNRLLGVHCNSLDHPQMHSIQVMNSQYAIVLVDCDRSHAVEYANELLQRIESSSNPKSLGQPSMPMTISIGVATIPQIPRNYSVEPIYDGALRCLNGAQLSGGKSVKSIEVF